MRERRRLAMPPRDIDEVNHANVRCSSRLRRGWRGGCMAAVAAVVRIRTRFASQLCW